MRSQGTFSYARASSLYTMTSFPCHINTWQTAGCPLLLTPWLPCTCRRSAVLRTLGRSATRAARRHPLTTYGIANALPQPSQVTPPAPSPCSQCTTCGTGQEAPSAHRQPASPLQAHAAQRSICPSHQLHICTVTYACAAMQMFAVSSPSWGLCWTPRGAAQPWYSYN